MVLATQLGQNIISVAIMAVSCAQIGNRGNRGLPRFLSDSWRTLKMKQKKILLGLLLIIILGFAAFFVFREYLRVRHQNEGTNLFNSGIISGQTPMGGSKFKSSRMANGSQQSTDLWKVYVEEKTERLYQEGVKNSPVKPGSNFRDVIREAVENEVTELKKQYTTPPLRIGVEIPEKYTGPQTVEALMETFEAYDRQGAQGDTLEEDEKYPRAEWLAVLLEKEGAIRNYTDYSHWLGIRGNLIGFERDGNWVEGAQGVPPMDDWETFKAAYIDRQAWEHQQMSMGRENDPNAFGGLFTGPDDRIYLPGRADRVYVQRKARGAFFHGAPLTQKQQWEIMLQGKHPEGYEIIYIDENGTVLSEPPPPIPPPTGEERRQLEAWLKRGENQQTSDMPDQTSEDWDSGGQDRLSRDEIVSAEVQATQKRFERAQTEAFERTTKSDAEIGAGLEKQLTPELPTAAGIETQLSDRFSPERLEKAREVLERYGPEEGMRRLRKDDPEVAALAEQSRRDRQPAGDETDEPENPTR